MSDEIEHYVGSGNIFADLELDEPEMRLNRAMLAHRIRGVIRERGLTQTAAAKILGIDQPKVSAIIRGRLSDFSIERLASFLERLDQEVVVSVRPKRRSEGLTPLADDMTPTGQSAVRPPST